MSLQAGDLIAVFGGTGALGSGLARRWARAGYAIVLGSRDPARAQGAADEINAAIGAVRVSTATYQDAAARARVCVLTVPFESQAPTLEPLRAALAGKVLVDCTAPLKPPKVGTVQLPPEGSAGQRAQALLGPEVTVVSAFQNVGADLLQRDETIDCDVLVCADKASAREIGVQLAQAAGMRGIEAGPLANAAAAEALTSVLITLNRRYKADHAGIRITGLPQTAAQPTGPRPLTFTPLPGVPQVRPGDDLAALIVAAISDAHVQVREGDVVIVAQKVVSKAAGLIVDLETITPSERAREIGAQTDKDPRLVEIILRESREVVTQRANVLITEHLSGAVMANAGVDRSNVDPQAGGEPALLLPRDPDAAAQTLREALTGALGCDIGLIISDSWGRPWRLGTTGAALGVAGLAPLHDYRGRADLFGRELKISIEAVADELAGAGNILMGQADEGTPVVIVSGFQRQGANGAAKHIQRPRGEDLFR